MFYSRSVHFFLSRRLTLKFSHRPVFSQLVHLLLINSLGNVFLDPFFNLGRWFYRHEHVLLHSRDWHAHNLFNGALLNTLLWNGLRNLFLYPLHNLSTRDFPAHSFAPAQ